MLRTIAALCAAALLVVGCGGESGPLTPFQQGRTTYGNVCSACHGGSGDGGTGPSLHDVTSTFPACEDHIEWVTIGSEGWRETHGDSYGAADNPVKGGMPAHGASLSAEDIALVTAFERITYGGAEESSVFADCGIDDASTIP